MVTGVERCLTSVSHPSTKHRKMMPDQFVLPGSIKNVEELEELLSRPTEDLIADLARVEGDILILGGSGKVGPTLARMARRAAPQKRIIAVSRFSDPSLRGRLNSWKVETMSCDLFDRDAVGRLPRLPNVIFMVGRKFGTTGQEELTWATNVQVPAIVAETFVDANIIAFSTLCVYPFADVGGSGWDETAAVGPIGEYANSCVGRERVFQYFSQQNETPGRLIRLNYAIDLRYGVLHDVASRVWQRQPVDVTTPLANVIWQGDAIAQILRALRHCTIATSPLNVGSPDHASIQELANAFGKRFGTEPILTGRPADMAWINDTSQATSLFGPPVISLDHMIEWTADWVSREMPGYDKPTRYEVRNGRF